MPPTVDVNPVHGCANCYFISQLLQQPEFCVYDLLDGVGILEFWDVIGLPSNKYRCEGLKKFGWAAKVPLLRQNVRLHVDGDGSGEGKEVVSVDSA